ncbi:MULTISPECIES: hypothetical protein [Bacillus]|uniref:hypothetical protein n=1 Tax=Bacillus TaxID=1386 RepID=UPI0002D22D67|nr:hypothetical protein [Bacillus sp. GeD10]HEF1857077.1 hypothetical protein [Bacillus cereus]CCW09134.1 hypothetical protein EBGED10_58790 [Bacillus sp. GeD10]HEF1869405.1 hypothetical protein [Bacillus cereus]HEF1879969.1 hypothetical protein [Bacillus cereus]HEF1886052.1 hypothetical protein [Bacillus cereus]
MLNALEVILFLVSIVSIIVLIIGLFMPKIVLRGEKINRLRVVKIYLSTALISFIVCMVCINLNPDRKDSNNQDKKTVATTTASSQWKSKITEIASSNKTPNEKFDEISRYAHSYKPTKDEIKTFGDEIIKEYTNKTYIKDVSNHEYMLTNIFKSEVVERNASEKPLKDFAFDFWQNSKYNYRGVENATSSATQANERQMDKALGKMNK